MARFNKHIIIVGSARSGTSWLAETIAKQHRYRLLFEPDHEFQTKKGHLLCDKWVENFQEVPLAKKYLKKVFSNTVDCDWIAQNSTRKYKRHLWPLIPKKIVIKFVRANLMASTLERDFGIPVIQIIRNPYDVIASQMRVKFPWLFDLEHFKNQPRLVRQIKEQFDYNLLESKLSSEIETLTLRWCIENCELEPVSETNKIKYESLCGNVLVFRDMCLKYNLVSIKNLDEQFSKPSSKTHPKSTILGAKKASDFNEEQLIEINKLLDIFKISVYERRYFSK